MRRSRLRILAGVVIVGNVVAVAVALARPPTRPDGPATILDCTLWLLLAQLLIAALYAACTLYCWQGLPEDAPEWALPECLHTCLAGFLWAEIGVIIGYLLCVMSTLLT